MRIYEGKTAVVIGGTIGVGLATAQALLDGSAAVLLTGRNPSNVAAAQRALGPHAHVVQSDVASTRDLAALAAHVEATLGRVDFLFVNAGVAELEPFDRVTPATGTPAMAVYSGTKAAPRAFTRVLAAELLGRRVRVNAVAPGFIRTPTLGVAGATAEERTAFERAGDVVTPMRRHGTAEEVARAALFLAFDATFTTGAELPVDGGLSQVDAPAA